MTLVPKVRVFLALGCGLCLLFMAVLAGAQSPAEQKPTDDQTQNQADDQSMATLKVNEDRNGGRSMP